MKLIIVNKRGKRDLIVGKRDIQKSFQKKPFLHLISDKKGRIIAFCSISEKFFLMDKECFNLFGKSFLAKNRRLPFRKFLPYFKTLSLVITSRCNMACSYCFGNGGKRIGSSSSWTVLKSAIDYIEGQNKPVSVIFASPGEQVNDFQLFKKTLNYVKKKFRNKFIMVSVNGTGDPNRYLEIIDSFDTFQISFDGPPEIQDNQRPLKNGKKSSLIVEKTIKKLVEKDKRFTVKTVVTDLHKGKEEYLCKYFYDLGIKEILLASVRPLGAGDLYIKKVLRKRSWSSFVVSLARSELKIKELCNFLGLKAKLVRERSLGSKKTHHCTLGYLFDIGVDGNVSTCPAYAGESDFNVYKGMEGLMIGKFNYKRKVFEMDEKKIKKLRNVYKKAKCSNCDFKLCWGGCPLRNFRENKDITIPDKKSCIETKKETYELFKSFAQERVVKVKPCLIERNKRLFYSMQFNEFELNKSGNQKIKGNPFIEFDPARQNFRNLLKKIISLSKKNKKNVTLFLFSPIASERLNFRVSNTFKNFLFELRRNKIVFRITKPIKITDVSPEEENRFYETFLIPRNCFDCLEMFKVRNNQIKFCNGTKGPKMNKVFDREEIYSEFQNMGIKKCYDFSK